MSLDRYGFDVLGGDWRAPKRGRSVEVVVELGLVVEEVTTDWCGAIVRADRDLGTVELEDRRGRRRAFPLGPGFLLDGAPVTLVAAPRPAPARKTRTASGSVAPVQARFQAGFQGRGQVAQVAQVARASRIFVEGRHDAELVEKVWGDDLRVEGVVVEYLGGVDDLEERLVAFGPTRQRRVGVLVDHLVPGTKESRVAARVAAGRFAEHVLVVGHPYVDIWQAVKPDRVGIAAWSYVPPGTPWKHGACRQLGWPDRDQADIARAWRRILSRVSSYADLEPTLLARVEELIDFVTIGD